MSIRCTTTKKTSDLTFHTASASSDGWVVSWLPGRFVTRDQATTGMVIAEIVAKGGRPGHRLWRHVKGFAAELGLSAADVVDAFGIGDEPT